MINRRDLLVGSAAGLLMGSLTRASSASAAEDHRHHQHHQAAEKPQQLASVATAKPGMTAQGYRPVITPNARTLPYRLNNGVKEFHLVAEEVEHEFAPGMTIKAWGYNGSTPGPTLEAVEGDRVRIYVTNKLPEHTSVHWHGILLPWGMDGISGLTQPPIKPGDTFMYEFTLQQHGTHMYQPHADEMVQMA